MEDIKSELDRIEKAILKEGEPSRERDFWRMVSRVKRDPKFTRMYAEQIGRIDGAIFRQKAGILVPLKLGNFVEMAAAIFIIVISYELISSEVYTGIVILACAFGLTVTLHPLAHYAVGRVLGIKFTFYFPDGPALIEPTIKTDYATYLTASPLKRASMHAAGPIISTLVIAMSLVMAIYIEAPPWTSGILLGLLIFNSIFEVLPPLLVKLGKKRFAKSDAYRTLREWKVHMSLDGHKS